MERKRKTQAFCSITFPFNCTVLPPPRSLTRHHSELTRLSLLKSFISLKNLSLNQTGESQITTSRSIWFVCERTAFRDRI
uniref:Uncharacterized protein n=1 Tax=Salix viminalis TaxID=40686 RepID=A0A6N2KJU3_SALVM